MIVQFICRGNAFRSIIAEAYLNSLKIPNLKVVSSGTVASRHKEENLVRFPETLALLKRHGIDAYMKDHIADDISQSEIDKSDIVVFLNKIAHDEAAGNYKTPERTYIWDVADIGEGMRKPTNDAQREKFMEDAYEEIVENIEALRRASQF